MARAELVTVDGDAAVIASGDQGTATVPASVVIKVPAGEATIYLGGSTVDATDGFPLAAGESIALDLTSEDLYAFCATSSDVNCLYLRG